MTNVEKIFEMLGMKPNEKFEFEGVRYYIDDELVTHKKLEYQNTWIPSLIGISDFICKQHKIVKLPWKPNANEYYYYVRPDGCVEMEAYFGDIIDFHLYKEGNCYETNEEITDEIKQEWIKYYEDIREEIECE